jgi:uncharacterized protein YecE (DUF72 family)
MSELRIGTCSWKVPSWHGLVYTAPTGINYLQEYAQYYNSVEIDQWFWSLWAEDDVALPRPKDVDDYRGSVPEDFRFTIKAPNSVTLTHFYRTDPLLVNPHFLSVPVFEAFLSRLEPMRHLLGPIMLQFEYLNRRKMPSLEAFLRSLDVFAEQVDRSLQYAIEVRNPAYLSQSLFEFLDRHGWSMVLQQGYWMPPMADVYAQWRERILQHERVVIRLHGPDRQGIEEITGRVWNRLVAPKDGELEALGEMAREMLRAGLTVYLNVNNHYEGSAPLTIERIEQILGADAPSWPGKKAIGRPPRATRLPGF